MQNIEKESLKVVQENKELTEYLDFLEDVMVCTNCSGNLRNTGWPFDEVCRRQVYSKMKEVKTSAQKSLWFLESFGLSLDSIKVKGKDGNLVMKAMVAAARHHFKSFHGKTTRPCAPSFTLWTSSVLVMRRIMKYQ